LRNRYNYAVVPTQQCGRQLEKKPNP